jgi:VanZ family protein
MQQEGSADRRAGLMALSYPSRVCLFAVLIAAVYFLGTSLFSAARMKPTFYPIFTSLLHVNGQRELFYYLSIVRWTAHYLEYFGLFMLLVWLLGMRPLAALLLCLLVAAADEGHQYFLPDRTCSLRDLGYDSAGAASAFLITLAASRLRAAPRSEAGVLPERTGRAPA